MKELKREKIQPINTQSGDSIILSVEDLGCEREVLKKDIEKTMTLDEAVIFEVESDDFKDAKGGIGGAFLETGE